MTREQANAVYDILAREAGATEAYRAAFVEAYTSSDGTLSWLFQGRLGFDGRFHLKGGRRWVTCHPSDRNPEREQTIQRVNARLAVLSNEPRVALG